ncbi:MAG: SocA family protein [Blastocatellia bacterium]|nr:SocA family protein [Blastocatellia bacterium]
MLINRNREKLLNAIVFFCKNTSSCYKTKLFKLLYFLDFEHYKETGRSVTGLDYYAWPKGPVPADLSAELDDPQPDFQEKIDIELVQPKPQRKMFIIEPKAQFDPTVFTKRELRLLYDLSDRYALSNAEEMVEATHLPTLPWHKVYEEEGRKFSPIPYDYALDETEKESIKPLAIEHQEMLSNYE